MASQIQSLQDFVQSLSSATLSQFVAAPGGPDAKAFEEMRRFLIDRYRDVESKHTFEMADGVIVDCVPIAQQPSLRGAKPATPPSMPPPAAYSGSAPDFAKAQPPEAPPQLDPNYKDQFGNQHACPAGTIPMVRLTLEQLTRFESLQDFFQKAPGGGRHPRDLGASDVEAEATHKYAHALQNVANIGGSSLLNTWKPSIGTNQIFSLSQQWYAAGSGAGLQTLECGWQVFPQLYSTDRPCLFIYWTRAGYAPNSGCYNLSCTAFVQTSSHGVLGGPLVFSTPGTSTQYEYQVGFLLDGGNWWFSFNGQWLGYYPASIFLNGPLSVRAENIDYGGETVGTGTWPPMGSGVFPGGFGTSAFQRAVVFYPPSGGAANAQLTESQPSPGCYRIALVNNSGTEWGTYFFFGGPGGTGC